jgi:hypothetical protein
MKLRARYGLLVGIALLAIPSTLDAHPTENTLPRTEQYEWASSSPVSGRHAAGMQLAQTSQSGPGPVTPDGSPAVNVDPYTNLRNYTPPPNTNFRPPTPGCSGDLATVGANVQDA